MRAHDSIFSITHAQCPNIITKEESKRCHASRDKELQDNALMYLEFYPEVELEYYGRRPLR
jgi:hypothetical protein